MRVGVEAIRGCGPCPSENGKGGDHGAKITVITGRDVYVEEEAAFAAEQLRGEWLVRLNASSGGGVWVHPANVVLVRSWGTQHLQRLTAKGRGLRPVRAICFR